MSTRSIARISFAALLLAAAIGAGSVQAEPIVGGIVFTGELQEVELQFAESDLHAEFGGEGGPIVEVMDGPPYLGFGMTGKGGGDLNYEKNSLAVCALNEGQDWSLTVDPQAASATLISNEPACAGVVEWVATGPPSITVTPSVTTPGTPDGAGVRLEITISREAAATGTFAGDTVTEVVRSIIRYTRIVLVGAGATA